MEKKDVILNVLFCLGTAGLSLFVQECMKKGMIFQKYGDWLNNTWDSIDRATWYKKRLQGIMPIKAKIAMFLLKPLGMCIYCFSSWVFIVLFTVKMLNIPNQTFDFIGLLLGLGFNFAWVKILEKYVYSNEI